MDNGRSEFYLNDSASETPEINSGHAAHRVGATIHDATFLQIFLPGLYHHQRSYTTYTFLPVHLS